VVNVRQEGRPVCATRAAGFPTRRSLCRRYRAGGRAAAAVRPLPAPAIRADNGSHFRVASLRKFRGHPVLAAAGEEGRERSVGCWNPL